MCTSRISDLARWPGWISSPRPSHLGLPLDEIRELLEAWEAGACADVRTRLRPLVAARIAEAERRIAELTAFAAHLATVHEKLDGPAPVDVCGPGCGCVAAEPSEHQGPPGPVLIELTGPVSGATR